jgi:hypothetical protein
MKPEIQIQHTPGPWEWDGDPSNDLIHYREENAPWLTSNDGRIPVIRGDVSVANLADARLIAAAPDLLAALNGLMGAYGAADGRNGNSGECWDSARAAIAKAAQS